MLYSNIVGKQKMREVQSETLQYIKVALINSFGPMGSNTIIAKEAKSGDIVTKYTKDGHTILSNLVFQNVIEASVKTDLEDLTRYIVKTVGDGTTSAVILSSIIFEKLKEIEAIHNLSPYQIITEFKNCVETIKTDILNNVQKFDYNKAYEIALISTNQNERIASTVRDIYKEYGNDVFVDVSISNTPEDLLKVYDGMTLETGYSDTAYINDPKKGIASIRNARVYAFEDPVDTREMFTLFDTIIANNIVNPYSDNSNHEPIPTVILAPVVSRDMSAYMEKLVEFMYKFDNGNSAAKPPFLLITNFHQKEQFVDIARLCGCKMIKKYINPDQQQLDIAQGLAPTIETICDFYGQADIVEADIAKTKFVNPKLMHDEDGNTSQTFNTLVNFLEAELKKAYEEGQDNNVTGNLKRRINSLKANMVEYLVGGVSVNDRDSVRDLVEDAVLNCRSAARHGVGYGANFEGLKASDTHAKESIMFKIIHDAYVELILTLYKTCNSDSVANDLLIQSLTNGKPYNLKSNEFDDSVLCSIMSDITILETISKIVSIMFTSNQFLCPTPVHNRYQMDQQ